MSGLAVGYLVMVGAAMVYAEAVRYQAYRQHRTDDPGRPTPVLVGYLCGGPRRAVDTAVAVLLSQGAIEATDDGRLMSTLDSGRPRPSGHGLNGAVLAAADGTRRLTDLVDEPDVRDALANTRTDLELRGWARTEGERRRARRGTVPLILLFAGGVIWALVTRDRPVVLGALVAGLGLIRFLDVKIASGQGQEMLQQVQQDHGHLRPQFGASRALHNARTLPMSVALFGPAPMWIVNPGFARRAGVRATLAAVGDEQAGSGIRGATR